MADIQLKKDHTLDTDTLRTKLEAVAADLKKKYGISSAWSGNTCNLSGTGLKNATLTMNDKAVEVEITLGLLGKALKSTIEKQLTEELDQILS